MKRILYLIIVFMFSSANYSQKRIQFTYKDNLGCVFVFKTETGNGQNIALISASNKKNARLEIPAKVSNNGSTYVVTRIESEALKSCDNGIRELIFPNTVETIGGLLFGGVTKLSGGFGGLMKGGTGGPLSKIILDRIVIPQGVSAIGGSAFLTGYVKTGLKGLSGNIEELPVIVMPWHAKDYGLERMDVTNYWRRKDPSRLSPVFAAEAKQKKLQELYELTPQHHRKDMLKYFSSNDETDLAAVKTVMEYVSDYGITREEYIAALQGMYSRHVALYSDEYYYNIAEDISKGEIDLSSYVVQVIDLESKEQQDLLGKFQKYEAKRDYKNAGKTITNLIDYTSEPLLSFVRAVCLYNTGDYKKSMDECLSALNDGRLTDDEKMTVSVMCSISGEKYAEKMMQKIGKWERLLGVAEKAADNVINEAISNMESQDTSPQVNTIGNSAYSDYYTSPAYLAQVQARADKSMADYQAQLQRIGQQSMNNLQKEMNRSKEMFSEMSSWSLRFVGQNGREPTELEKLQWVQQNYPDMYASFVQALTAKYEQSSDRGESEIEGSKERKAITNTYDCSYCGGTGRLLQDDETLSFGLPVEKEYKCNECGKWKIKGRTHRHYDCPHCKKGKVTYN